MLGAILLEAKQVGLKVDWVKFIENAPPRLSVPRIRGTAGVLYGFRVRAATSATLMQMVRPR